MKTAENGLNDFGYAGKAGKFGFLPICYIKIAARMQVGYFNLP